MKYFKDIRVFLLAFVLLFSFNTITYGAVLFKDVSTSHWAYNSISEMAEEGIMLGDTEGKFNPNAYMDKFETSQILARAAGYNYTNLTAEEQKFYDNAYEKNKNLLKNYDKTFTLWNTSSDREIAFLLEKGILLPEDLAQFIVKDAEGNEKLRALSREEAAVFLVRLIDAEEKALSGKYTYKFLDDNTIRAENKPYVYYLQQNGVIAGDPNGNFNPNDAVNRASMAVMLDKTLDLGATVKPTNTPAVQTNDFVGKFDKYFVDLNAIQIIDTTGVKKIFDIADNATVFVDGKPANISSVKTGMSVEVTVNTNNEVVEVIAKSSTATPEPLPTATPVQTATPLPTPAPVPTPTPAPTVNPEIANQKLTIEGVISNVTNDANNKSISVDVKMVNTKGEIITETRKLAVTPNTTIARNGEPAGFETIVVGDVVKVGYTGATANSITLEEKNRSFVNATIIDKKYIEETGTPILVIEDSNKKIYELTVTDDSFISRQGHGQVNWSELRVGDKVDGKAEYDKLTEIYAYGTFSAVKGTVEEIHLNKTQPYIILLNAATNQEEKYYLISSSVNIYDFRLGDHVELKLDSKEVASFITQPSPTESTFTGYIQSTGSNAIKVKSSITNNAKEQEIKINPETIIINSVSNGERVSFSSLHQGMKVYVVFEEGSTTVAKSINIISE